MCSAESTCSQIHPVSASNTGQAAFTVLAWLCDIDFRYKAIVFTNQILPHTTQSSGPCFSLPLPASAIITASRWQESISFTLLWVNCDA